MYTHSMHWVSLVQAASKGKQSTGIENTYGSVTKGRPSEDLMPSEHPFSNSLSLSLARPQSQTRASKHNAIATLGDKSSETSSVPPSYPTTHAHTLG